MGLNGDGMQLAAGLVDYLVSIDVLVYVNRFLSLRLTPQLS